jgi:hypothetical protein
MATLGTFTAGQVLTAAELNGIGTWTTFTPSWSNITVGNGVSTGRYSQINDMLFIKATFKLGSTSTMGTNPGITIPGGFTAENAGQAQVGSVIYEDAGTATFLGSAFAESTTILRFYVLNAAVAYAAWAVVTASVPMTWATNDVVGIDVMVKIT